MQLAYTLSMTSGPAGAVGVAMGTRAVSLGMPTVAKPTKSDSGAWVIAPVIVTGTGAPVASAT